MSAKNSGNHGTFKKSTVNSKQRSNEPTQPKAKRGRPRATQPLLATIIARELELLDRIDSGELHTTKTIPASKRVRKVFPVARSSNVLSRPSLRQPATLRLNSLASSIQFRGLRKEGKKKSRISPMKKAVLAMRSEIREQKSQEKIINDQSKRNDDGKKTMDSIKCDISTPNADSSNDRVYVSSASDEPFLYNHSTSYQSPTNIKPSSHKLSFQPLTKGSILRPTAPPFVPMFDNNENVGRKDNNSSCTVGKSASDQLLRDFTFEESSPLAVSTTPSFYDISRTSISNSQMSNTTVLRATASPFVPSSQHLYTSHLDTSLIQPSSSNPVQFHPKSPSKVQAQIQSNLKSPKNSFEKPLESLSDAVKCVLERPTTMRDPGAPRCYCTQLCTPELDEAVSELLSTLQRYQKNKMESNPLKAKKRLYMGLHEVLKYARRGKLKLVVLVRNIEATTNIGNGLDPTTNAILDACHENETPVVYSMTRGQMGTLLCGRKIAIACVGISLIDGAEELLRRVLQIARQLTDAWINEFTGCESATEASPIVRYNPRNENPLWLCAFYGYREADKIVDACIKRGWRLDEADSVVGDTPLLVAFRLGRMGFIRHVLGRHDTELAVLLARSFRSESALLLACQGGYDEALKIILEMTKGSSRQELLNGRDDNGITPLIAAARNGHVKCVAVLAQYWEELEIEAEQPYTGVRALEASLFSRERVEIVNTLLSASEKKRKFLSRGDKHDKAAIYPPLWSLRDKQAETALLVACKAVPDAETEPNLPILVGTMLQHATPLPQAQRNYGRKSMISYPSRAPPVMKPDPEFVNATDADGRTALWWAAYWGRKEVADVLLNVGKCNVSIGDNNNMTALDVIALGIPEKEEEGSKKKEKRTKRKSPLLTRHELIMAIKEKLTPPSVAVIGEIDKKNS